jgi:tRNA pseudouridine38-40 synthase
MDDIRRYRTTLAYDGTAYQGFQRQAAGIQTIQGAVEAAIESVSSQRVTVIGAGRTDTGVHATGQVIAFDLEWKHEDEALLRAINANLPDDIALQDIRQQPGFHPRFDALSRVYQYYIIQCAQRQPLLRYRAWQIYRPLDSNAMQAAASLLVGEHDFGVFGQPPQGENTIRQVFVSHWMVESQPYGLALTYRIEADAFLQHMVRRIVGMLVDVGRGLLTVAQFETIFRGGVLVGSMTVAPPQGLVLEEVRYPES